MRRIAWLIALLYSFLPIHSAGLRAEEPPEKEMLQLMELLEKWDMIQNLDVMRVMKVLEEVEGSPSELEPLDQPKEEPKGREK